ncbi:MAG: type II toxin-antitoxin system antitoxin, RelB/DinJ family, partial [Clostridiaceae bacterium]|nr:type II toxin-antitoxin system antitoxin, RelB/DinJ family [Clostridiaceae bacterium]
YLNQIYLTGGIPFSVTLPKAPDTVNADLMTEQQIEEKLMRGIDEARAGKTHDAAKAFDEFRKSR